MVNPLILTTPTKIKENNLPVYDEASLDSLPVELKTLIFSFLSPIERMTKMPLLNKEFKSIYQLNDPDLKTYMSYRAIADGVLRASSCLDSQLQDMYIESNLVAKNQFLAFATRERLIVLNPQLEVITSNRFCKQLASFDSLLFFTSPLDTEKHLLNIIDSNAPNAPHLLVDMMSIESGTLLGMDGQVKQNKLRLVGCFPISAEKFITVTIGGLIAQWTIDKGKAKCDKTLDLFAGKKYNSDSTIIYAAFQIRDHLLIKNSGQVVLKKSEMDPIDFEQNSYPEKYCALISVNLNTLGLVEVFKGELHHSALESPGMNNLGFKPTLKRDQLIRYGVFFAEDGLELTWDSSLDPSDSLCFNFQNPKLKNLNIKASNENWIIVSGIFKKREECFFVFDSKKLTYLGVLKESFEGTIDSWLCGDVLALKSKNETQIHLWYLPLGKKIGILDLKDHFVYSHQAVMDFKIVGDKFVLLVDDGSVDYNRVLKLIELSLPEVIERTDENSTLSIIEERTESVAANVFQSSSSYFERVGSYFKKWSWPAYVLSATTLLAYPTAVLIYALVKEFFSSTPTNNQG